MGILRERLKKYIIDKSDPRYQRKMENPDGVLVEIPPSLEGELLLEEDVQDGKIWGWYTVNVDELEGLFSKALEAYKAGKPLFDALMEDDDVYEVVDLSRSEEEKRRIREKYRLSPEAVEKMFKGLEGASITKIKIGEKGYKKWFIKWHEEGLI